LAPPKSIIIQSSHRERYFLRGLNPLAGRAPARYVPTTSVETATPPRGPHLGIRKDGERVLRKAMGESKEVNLFSPTLTISTSDSAEYQEKCSLGGIHAPPYTFERR